MYPLDPDTPIDQIFSGNLEHCRLLRNLGIDSRFDAGRSLAQECRQHGLDVTTITRVLAATPSTPRAISLELVSIQKLRKHLVTEQQIDLHHLMTHLDYLTRATVGKHEGDEPVYQSVQLAFLVFRDQFSVHLLKESEDLETLFQRLTIPGCQEWPGAFSPNARLDFLENEHSLIEEILDELHTVIDEEFSVPPLSGLERSISEVFFRVKRAVDEQIYLENHVLFQRVRTTKSP